MSNTIDQGYMSSIHKTYDNRYYNKLTKNHFCQQHQD